MPPKQTTTAFKGPGRVLGTGKEIPAKAATRAKLEDEEEDWRPSEDSDSDDEIISSEGAPARGSRHGTRNTSGQANSQILLREELRVLDGFAKERKRKLDDVSESEAKSKKVRMEPTVAAREEREDEEVKPGTSRSGLKRGFNKFGEGFTLGGAAESGK